MLTTAVLIVLACSILWGYDAQAENIPHITSVAKATKVAPLTQLHAIVQNKKAIVKKAIVCCSVFKSTEKDETNKIQAAVITDSTVTTVTAPSTKTQAAVVLVADEDEATPWDESMVLAYANNKPDTITPLNEAMVMKYSAQKKANGKSAVNNPSAENDNSAHPQIGWDGFGKYVNDNAISPDGKTGVVKLSFVVNANGSLSGFKIDKSLSDAADKAAIDIVKTGPSWAYAAANSQSKVVTVNVNFHRPADS